MPSQEKDPDGVNAPLRTGLLMIALTTALWTPAALAYIGPGVPLGLWGVTFGLLTGLVLLLAGLLSRPIRRLTQAMRRNTAPAMRPVSLCSAAPPSVTPVPAGSNRSGDTAGDNEPVS